MLPHTFTPKPNHCSVLFCLFCLTAQVTSACEIIQLVLLSLPALCEYKNGISQENQNLPDEQIGLTFGSFETRVTENICKYFVNQKLWSRFYLLPRFHLKPVKTAIPQKLHETSSYLTIHMEHMEAEGNSCTIFSLIYILFYVVISSI